MTYQRGNLDQSVINFIRNLDKTLPAVNISIIQCHASTTDKHETDIKEFYKEVKDLYSTKVILTLIWVQAASKTLWFRKTQ